MNGRCKQSHTQSPRELGSPPQKRHMTNVDSACCPPHAFPRADTQRYVHHHSLWPPPFHATCHCSSRHLQPHRPPTSVAQPDKRTSSPFAPSSPAASVLGRLPPLTASRKTPRADTAAAAAARTRAPSVSPTAPTSAPTVTTGVGGASPAILIRERGAAEVGRWRHPSADAHSRRDETRATEGEGGVRPTAVWRAEGAPASVPAGGFTTKPAARAAVVRIVESAAGAGEEKHVAGWTGEKKHCVDGMEGGEW